MPPESLLAGQERDAVPACTGLAVITPGRPCPACDQSQPFVGPLGEVGAVPADPRFHVGDAPHLAHCQLVVRGRPIRSRYELLDALTAYPETRLDFPRAHQVLSHDLQHSQEPSSHLTIGQRSA